MKDIKCIVEFIQEELEDAEKYAKKALKYKDSDKPLAAMYEELAKQELSHSERLHEHAVRLIDEKKRAGYQAPETMRAVWDWEHEKAVEHKAKIKSMLEMYRG